MEEMRSFGYICPACGKAVLHSRSVFALNAAAARMECECGKEALTAETDGLRFRLNVPCGVCGGHHQAKEKASPDEAFTDNVIMYEVLSELKDIAARGGIACACGSHEYTMQVRRGAVDLTCAKCGGRLRLPAATDSDLDDLCCRMTLTIPGR